MHIDDSEGLLLASLKITYNGRTKTIDRMAIDTGAEHTIIVSDAVDDLGIAYKNGDRINRSQGIGGADSLDWIFSQLAASLLIWMLWRFIRRATDDWTPCRHVANATCLKWWR